MAQKSYSIAKRRNGLLNSFRYGVLLFGVVVFIISEITVSLGFSSQSAFSATFRKFTGKTPLQFRNRYSDEYPFRYLAEIE